MEASDCREWDCAGIPHQPEAVGAAVGAVVVVVAAAGSGVVRVVDAVAVEASVAADVRFESSWTKYGNVSLVFFLICLRNSIKRFLTCCDG